MLLVPNLSINRPWPRPSIGNWWDPEYITEAWDASTNVTVTGTGVSGWTGRKLGRVLAQGTDAKRPDYADQIISGNGTSDLLKLAFTLDLPFTFGGVWRVDDGAGSTLWDGGVTINHGRFLSQFPGSVLDFAALNNVQIETTTHFNVGQFYAFVVVYNNASSVIRVNKTVTVTGTTGTNNAEGLSIFGDAQEITRSASSTKAHFYCNTALDTAQQDATLDALMRQYAVAA